MELKDVAKAHIHAYNAMFEDHILESVVANIPPMVIGRAKLIVDEIHVQKPMLSDKEHISIDRRLLPRECRERNLTYNGRLTVRMSLYYDNRHVVTENKAAGCIPIMVRSLLCHLDSIHDKSSVGEDRDEIGGYFIVNGVDRLVRFNTLQKRNYAFAYIRTPKENYMTKHMISIRCVGSDEIGQMNMLHYCMNGNVIMKIFYMRKSYLIPVVLILKALVNTNDEEIFDVLGGCQRAIQLIKCFAEYNVFSKSECMDYIGSRLMIMTNSKTKMEAAGEVLSRCVATHLTSSADKFNFLVLAIKKLFLFVDGKVKEDDPDHSSNHELLTETQIFSTLLRDKIDESLRLLRLTCLKPLRSLRRQEASKSGSEGLSTDEDDDENNLDITSVRDTFKKFRLSIGEKLELFLSTGNITQVVSSDITNASGLSIVADRINFYRFIAHFRGISRGAYFETAKITKTRKLRPETWGFICPVHTPDGSPCGILTHLSKYAEVIGLLEEFDENVLFELGVVPLVRGWHTGVPVVVDGKVVGFTKMPRVLANALREYRCKNALRIEIVHQHGVGVFETVNVFVTRGRLTRKVLNRKEQKHEWIGIMEQIFLDIDLTEKRNYKHGYCEIDNTNILGIVAGLIPYSDYNQSPRNMYQCQMAKQTMGTPGHNMSTRTDVKLYSVNYLQSPIVQTEGYGLLKDYPMGLNCMVAVLSYTAYDMEDAVVINKGSLDRGLFTGYVYKNEKVVLKKGCHFTFLPFRGQMMKINDVLYKYIDDDGKEYTVKYHGGDEGMIDTVRVFQNDLHKCATFTIRVIRNPTIGDKFCSRHGQKGVCSVHWPSSDMPFTESGYAPDIIINPHAFPSRMTIGMLVESIAGKVGCLEGKVQDGTPFKKKSVLYEDTDKEIVSDAEERKKILCEELAKHGFNYYGNEPMYSGVSGNEFRVDVFVGVVFYQRLRHMVGDKFQVRTSGAVVSTTKQPVGGRKRHGGVRFGEMERDALIAHGSAYMLNDRLMKCSDATKFDYCAQCKSILFTNNGECRCGNKILRVVEMPYVFKYLCSELLAMNIKLSINF
ncbi:subunit B of DNA-directed RNA polymerase [Ordospora colligata]|uniref:DNA-directed RNA polymerase subunit beta n=1 Tax=Ordospora colligata OC4 TaxID=1354746 RepID=A0A0B2UME6_9MICR|nr:subunit B of DNA-directed RNA polymerase [Ordospora colligata OC4]KHN70140.1 subunit B of DNA-directed RNA polymerase [Ordospora colligata OC4]TBU16522.1 subunit B of DNA-directed RNA polymerase [Ordospora colligata]TBU16563.1 subunit B of DNA-directed RNA polymerase [Ordospora colligata]TBU19136.1 subunit B of DNA-directed RNA polymerase [Ordospora colligata]